MTLFARGFEAEHGIDTSEKVGTFEDAVDTSREAVTRIVLEGEAPEEYVSNPDIYSHVERLGGFEDADAFWWGIDSLGQEGPTMYMG